jgi:hypothetical protein
MFANARLKMKLQWSTDNKDEGTSYTGRMEWLPFVKFMNDGGYFKRINELCVFN